MIPNDSYWDGFDDLAGIEMNFKVALPDYIDVVVAYYSQDNWSGDAFVVYVGENGLVYEVNGLHCSCYGLEGQWEPEEVEIREILNRPNYVEEWCNEAGWREANDSIRLTLVNRFGSQETNS